MRNIRYVLAAAVFVFTIAAVMEASAEVLGSVLSLLYLIVSVKLPLWGSSWGGSSG